MERKSEGKATTSKNPKKNAYGLLYLAVVLWISYSTFQLSASSCDNRRTVPKEATATAATKTKTKTKTTKALTPPVDYPSPTVWTSGDELYENLLKLLQFAPAFEDSTTTSTTTTDHLLILKNFARAPTIPRDDIVLVTYITSLQTDTLSRLLHQWSGPASVAVYLNTPRGVDRFVDFFLSTTTGDDVPAWAHQVRYHLVMETASLSANHYHLSAAPSIPSNVLRNVALHSVDSDYFFSVDANLVPQPTRSTYQYLKSVQQEDPELWEQTFIRDKRLLFLPSFAPVDDSLTRLPRTAREVYELVKRKKWTPNFSLLLNPKKLYPVRSTEHWIHWSEDEDMFYEPLTSLEPSNIVWDPNLMGYRPGIHRYYEGVRDATFGKYAFLAEGALAGYSFGVWADVYGIYHQEYENRMQSIDDLDEYQDAFQEYLTNRYPRKQHKSRTEE